MSNHTNGQRAGFWWGCSGYQNGCKKIMDDKNGKPIEKIKEKISDIKCSTCMQNNLILRTGNKNKKYWACSGYPECKATFQNKNGSPIGI